MKVDLLYELQAPLPYSKPFPYGQREAEQKAYHDAIAQIRLADKLGYGTAWFVEHHFRIGRSHSPAPEVVIGALSQVTDNIRLGFGVALMPHPFRSPVLNAERIAAADIVTRGRLEWGTGRSTPLERIALGVKNEESREQWKEAIEVVVKIWETERFAYESKHMKFPALPRGDWEPPRAVTPKPYQDPHPPCWVACTSDESVEVAARNGLGMLSVTIQTPVDTLAQRIRRYRELSKEATPLTRVHNTKVAPYTLVATYEDMDAAQARYDVWESVAWWYTHIIDFTIEWELPPMTDEEQRGRFPNLEAARNGTFDPRVFSDQDMIIVGNVDECLDKFERYQRIGCDAVLAYVQFGHLPHEAIMETLEVIGTRIIPQLEKNRKTYPLQGFTAPVKAPESTAAV
jgi:alkanesulfonate monooxygenase SsuD/methylene tetrahydromethanopterin reductase-like flavin-dependent oxidoreductase (luciferase family)